MPELPHGRSRWLAGCRCEVCHADLLLYARMRRAVQAVKAGREPEWRVPATRSRRRLERLRAAGLSLREIAELSGVAHSTLRQLVRGVRPNVTIVTEQRLGRAAEQARRPRQLSTPSRPARPQHLDQASAGRVDRLAAWWRYAACRGRAELFYSANPISQTIAVAVCASCGVRDACLAAARAEEGDEGPAYGVRGGLTAGQRVELRRVRLGNAS